MKIVTSVLVIATALLLLNERRLRVFGIGLPVNQLTYIVSGAHLQWTSPGDRLRATESGEYMARNVVPTKMAMRHDGTIFLAMPRLKRGVPFTLGAIEYDPCQSTIEPTISPYPCSTAHRQGRQSDNWTMVNVVDVFIDDSGVLWALDVGKVNLLENVVVVRSPMVYAFDTDTDEIIRAIDLSRATTASSCLQSIVVEHNPAAGVSVYVSDAGLGNVIVYNVACDRSFKVHVPVGPCGHRDVMYMVLAWVNSMDMSAGGGMTRYRRLYVTYLSSCDMMYVPVHVLDESTTSLATVTIGRKPCKMIILGTDHGSLVYFRTGDSGDVLRWNVNAPFLEENFRSVQHVHKSRIPMMITVGFRGYQWIMESNFIDFLVGDIGCLGISTRIQPLRHHADVDDDDRQCTTTPIPCDGQNATARAPIDTEQAVKRKMNVYNRNAAPTPTTTAKATVESDDYDNISTETIF